MIDTGLIVARLVHYIATTTLAGVAFFPLYAHAGQEPRDLMRWRKMLLLASATIALLSGIIWFAFATANMSGDPSDVMNQETLRSVMRDTDFGTLWTGRMLLAAVTVVMALLQAGSSASGGHVMPILAAGLLGSLAGVGHTQVEEGWAGAVHVTSDAAHLLAAGAWLGGLVPLAFVLGRKAKTTTPANETEIDRLLIRFSGMGYGAVATLLGTGFVNSWFLVGSVPGLLHTSYGQILLIKLTFFAGMLALAAANRFWLVPALEASRARNAGSYDQWRSKLRHHVKFEQAFGLLVLACVSILGTMRPAIGQ